MSYSEKDNEILDQISSSWENILKKISNGEFSLEKSIDRRILFIKLILTIKSLVQDKELEHEIIEELKKSFTIKKFTEEDKNKYLVYDSDMYILRRIHGKKKITVSEILSKNSKSSDILDYIWLRKKGYLKKGRDGRLLVDPNIYSIDFEEEKQRRIELDDIFKHLNEIPSRLWPRIINYSILEKLDNNKFMDTISKIFGYNTRIDQEIVEELEKRFKKGWKPSSSDWKVLTKIMKKNTMLMNKYIGPYSLQWYRVKDIDRGFLDKIVNDIVNMPLKERWKIVSKMSSIKRYEDILEKLDPITLSSIKNPYRHKSSLTNKILLGQCLTSYIQYLLTMGRQYLDYSMYILSKIDPDKLDNDLKPLYKSLIEKDQRSILNYIGRKLSVETLEYIAFNTWDLLLSKGLDNNLISRALKLGYEVLKYSLRGTEYRGRYKYSRTYGRVAVKKTIYNYVRGNYDIIRKHREKQLRVIAVVDISGSMLRYSLWAILALTSILPIVKTVVLFSDKTYVSKPPSSFSKPLIIGYLEKIFREGFKGYTNISRAFREVGRVASGNETVIVFSDLEQTVKDTNPWDEAYRLLESKCRRLIVFVPPSYRSDVGEYFKRVGAEIIVVNNPSNIPRLLRRRLNLKIRVNIFPS